MGKRFSDVKRFGDEKKWEDDVEWFQFPDGRMVLIRTFGDIEVLARHWIRTMSGKMFPAWCPRLNKKEELDHSRPCPAHADFDDKAQKMMLSNAIIRQQQERGDPNPVKGIMLPHAVMDDLGQIAELIGGDPSDDDKGVDLAITFNSKAVGNKKWSIQRGDTTPLSDAERKYRSYLLAKIVPDFDDPEVAGQYARNMKEAMARHKYYVVPEGRVPENARDPFKYFRGDPRGQPWTDFPVLVDYRNAEKGDSAGTYRVSGGGNAQAQPMYDRNEPAQSRPTEAAAPPDRGAEASARTASTDQADGAGAVSAERGAGRAESDDAGRRHEGAAADAGPGAPGHDIGQQLPDGVPTVQDPRYGTVPECFGKYKGAGICTNCSERARCIDVTDDEEM